jgi:hypothetical protein
VNKAPERSRGCVDARAAKINGGVPRADAIRRLVELGLNAKRRDWRPAKVMKSAKLLLLMSSILTSAVPVLAQGVFGSSSIESCDDYVARAMSQVQMGTGCNFAGLRWSSNSADHMNWCKRASARDRGEENGERQKALVNCRGDIGVVRIPNCYSYASRARSEIELAQLLGSSCTFRGERWNSNLVQHMNWCNRTDTRAHELEDAARRKELAECKVVPAK